MAFLVSLTDSSNSIAASRPTPRKRRLVLPSSFHTERINAWLRAFSRLLWPPWRSVQTGVMAVSAGVAAWPSAVQRAIVTPSA